MHTTAREMYPEAVREYLKAEELHMTTLAYPAQITKLKDAYAVGGIRAFWRERIEMLKGPTPTGGYAIARYHARLGERDEALKWFKRAYDTRDFGLVFLVADPAHSDLFADPRFRELAELLLGRDTKEQR